MKKTKQKEEKLKNTNKIKEVKMKQCATRGPPKEGFVMRSRTQGIQEILKI